MADAGKSKRDLMGSKADMISTKFNEVQRNSIWCEHAKKEQKMQPEPNPFHEKTIYGDQRTQLEMPVTSSQEIGYAFCYQKLFRSS